jgi:hypothetical protein
MPRVIYTSAKGLHQDTGKGLQYKQESASDNTHSNTTILFGAAKGATPYEQSATQLFPLGSKLIYGERSFRYVKMNGAVTAGKLVQQAVHTSNHTNNTVTNLDAGAFTGKDGIVENFSHAVGSRSLILELIGDTDITADEYAEGYALVNDAQGEGQLLKIRTHQSVEQGADATMVINTYDPLTTAIVKNASQISLIRSIYKDVIVAPQAETGAALGVTVIDMLNDYYGWIAVSGPAAVLADSTLVIGHRVVRTDGSGVGGVMADNGDDLTAIIGQVFGTGVVSGEYALIHLQIE